MCGCLLCTPYWGPWPTTQACALTGNGTGDLSFGRLAVNQLSHTSQGNFFYCYSITVVPTSPPLHPSSQLTLCSYSQFQHCRPCPWVIHVCSLTSLFLFFLPLSPSSIPSGHCQSVPYVLASSSVLLISLFCSLDSSYR